MKKRNQIKKRKNLEMTVPFVKDKTIVIPVKNQKAGKKDFNLENILRVDKDAADQLMIEAEQHLSDLKHSVRKLSYQVVSSTFNWNLSKADAAVLVRALHRMEAVTKNTNKKSKIRHDGDVVEKGNNCSETDLAELFSLMFNINWGNKGFTSVIDESLMTDKQKNNNIGSRIAKKIEEQVEIKLTPKPKK